MTAAQQDAANDALLLQPCHCPVCTGLLPVEGAENSAIYSEAGGPQGAPLSSLPQLSSNPTATAKLFLDFDGHFESSWSFRTNVTTPAFSQDGNTSDFTAAELSAIQEIWARVAEDYAPFNIDVTTIDPGHQTDRVVAVVAIGGSYSDWYGSGAGGVAFVGGFSNFSPNVGYVFSNSLGNGAKNVAEAASHEAGHLFGLSHQSRWSGTTLSEQYHSGSGNWAPIMGNSYAAARSTWHNGATNASSTSYQDDLAVISGATNGFGYRTDDFGSTVGTASNLSASGGSVNFTGLIGRTDDQDVWSFTTTGGTVSFSLSGATYGTNLDAVLELANSSGTIIASDAPTGSLGASLSLSVGAGTYFLIARGAGDYGNVGQYTMTGTLPAAGTAPTASVSVSGSSLTNGGTLAFGSTTAGTSVSRTITVSNTGNATLTLTSLNAGSMPAGFTLVQNLGSTSLAPGASTTFIVRLDATTAGSYSGQISLATNDSAANPFTFQVSGTVTAPSIAASVSGSALASGGTVSFGSTTVGTVINRTITITNNGNATLTLTPLGTMPAGFTLVQNLGSTSLAPGASTTFVLRLDASAVGNFSGQISLSSNAPGQSPFTINLSGSVSAVQLPAISFSVGGSALTSGGMLNFGSTTVGTPVTRTITVSNQGTATLTLTSLSGVSLPAGFSLVQDFGSTSIAAGANTTFVLRLTATAAGSFSGQVSVVSNDATRSPFSFSISGSVASVPVVTPEISIWVDGVPLTPGGTLNFGSCQTGGEVTKTITITNTGSGTLTLTPLAGVTLPAGFTLVQDIQSTSLAAGASTTLILRFCGTAAGNYTGQVCLTSNDPMNGSLTFNVSGSVTPAAYQGISDDGTASNRLVGGWKLLGGRGYADDVRTASKGTGSIFSTWNFTNLPAGQYQIFATWTAGAKNATNSPFSISNGNTLLKTTRVSQRLAPTGAVIDGASWRWLGTVTITGGNLLVKLTNNANGLVVADAVRVQQISSSAADLATTHYAGAGVSNKQADVTAAFSSRGDVHLDALPLPNSAPSHGNVPADSFHSLLDLLSSPQAGHSATAVDEALAGDTNWTGLAPLLA